MKIPEDVVRVARFILDEGYKRAEAYPVELWRKKGWREDRPFFEAVDATIRLFRVLGEL